MDAMTSYKTMQQNTIKRMLQCVKEYEKVKNKKHPKFKTVRALFASSGICYQNFYKFYSRYIETGRDPNALLPMRRGPKPKYKDSPLADDSIEQHVLTYRKMGHNKYMISEIIRKNHKITKGSSPSTVYRILNKYGESRLTPALKEEKRKIIREFAGSLAHIDCHYLPRGIVSNEPNKRYFALGVIDDFSRLVWVEIISSTKALDATFGMLDALMLFNKRYNVKFTEALTDNGSEFCGGKNTKDKHAFEKLLTHFSIKHRRTKAYRPQTNGKIERFWRTFEDDVISGSVFNSLEELKEAVLGYNFYYNEHRPHQAINGLTPLKKLERSS